MTSSPIHSKLRLMTGILIFSSPFAWAAPANPQPRMGTQNVFNDDARGDAQMDRYPETAVGKLFTPNKKACTATLVDRDLILTAAHCVVEGGRLVHGNYLFYPAFKNGAGTPYAVTNIWRGTSTPDTDRADDWAILRLDQPAGDTHGWMGVEDTDLSDLIGQAKFRLVAYSTDWRGGNTPSSEINCAFTAEQDGNLLHNCDMTPGASGGAMFYIDSSGKPMIVAVNVAEFTPTGQDLIGVPYSNRTANLAVAAARFYPTLMKIKNSR